MKHDGLTNPELVNENFILYSMLEKRATIMSLFRTFSSSDCSYFLAFHNE